MNGFIYFVIPSLTVTLIVSFAKIYKHLSRFSGKQSIEEAKYGLKLTRIYCLDIEYFVILKFSGCSKLVCLF